MSNSHIPNVITAFSSSRQQYEKTDQTHIQLIFISTASRINGLLEDYILLE